MKVQSIVIIGRRYWHKSNGSTRHSCSVVVNGEFVCLIGETYGYDKQYVETGLNELQKRGIIERLRYGNGAYETAWMFANRTGIKVHYETADVSKLSALHQVTD